MARRVGRRDIPKALSVAFVAVLVTRTATAASDPEAKGGDLSHLVYTARTGLVARAISPNDGGVINTVATSFEVATVAGAGVEVAVNGKIVPVKSLGRRAELDDGTVHYTYYGVVLAPGANLVALTPLGADGMRGPSVIEHVWGPGPPAAIHATGCVAPHADGRTACAVRVAVIDQWGHPTAPGATLKAAVISGEAAILTTGISGGEMIADPTPVTAISSAGLRSISVVLSAGSTATILVVPGTIPGRIKIAAGIGSVSGSVQFDAMAFARPPFVNGLATMGVGAVPGELGADPTIADGTNSRRGRVALFGTGLLNGNAIGTLAYDTAGALAATSASGTFNDNPNDRPYATYGDSSIRRNDALTQDKLYARIDDGYTSAMWGQFEATTGPQGAAGAVAMQVDGAKVVVGSASTSVSAFTASNHVGYGREILTVTGLATLNSLEHNNLVIGSETITLVSLDRRTGVIRGQTTLQNVVDYTIDYTSGIIHFINVPLPYDAAFNPQQILVRYEYSAASGGAETTGARFEAPFGRFDSIRFGLGYLNDQTGTGDFTLLSENASGVLPGGVWALSHAASNGLVPGTTDAIDSTGGGGSAFRLAGATAKGPYKLSFGYDATSAAYSNPFGDLQSPGLTDYHASLLTMFGVQQNDVTLSYDHARTIGLVAAGSSTQSNLAAILHEKLNSRLTVRAGLTLHSSDTTAAALLSTGSAATGASAEAINASVTQANLGVDWKATHNLALSIERDQKVGGSDLTQPAQTTAQASWDLNGHGRIFARELMSDTPAQTFDSVLSSGSSSRAFELGIQQTVNANTSVESTYAVSGTGNGRDVAAAIGVKERLLITKLLKGDAFIQRGVGNGSAADSFTVFGITLGYGDAAGRIKATGSVQARSGSAGGATWSFGAAGKLFGDFSLLVADQGSRTLGTTTSDARFALAWRPSRSDRGALFIGYQRSAGNAAVPGAQSGVASLDGVYRLTRRFQLTGRYARKMDGDSNYVVGTSLVGVAARQQMGLRYDIGIETREVLSQSAGGSLHSTAVEFGSMLGNTLRAAIGYNFGSTIDPTLAAAPTRKGIYATLTTTIDRIFGWGAH